MVRRILVIDDDPSTTEPVAAYLTMAGYEVAVEHRAPEGLQEALTKKYDLVILDVAMPEMLGYDLCRRLRSSERYTPILFLSGQAEVIDRTLGLELGADDYLTKPFASQELLARVRAILRRYPEADKLEPSKQTILRFGDIEMNFEEFSVRKKGEKVAFTPMEFRLLACLATSPHRTFTREELREMVWGDHSSSYNQTITTTISRVRGKIEDDPSNPRYLTTVRGFGYRIMIPEAE